MKYADQYIKTAVKLLNDYDGSLPLHHYLKGKFAAEKKYGSKDRKLISHLCYCYFRLGHFLKDADAEEKIKVVLFLTGDENWKDVLTAEWISRWNESLKEKIAFIESKFHQKITSIFPWHDELSDNIDRVSFTHSHLYQPNFFIRIRPGVEAIVLSKLNESGIAYEQVTNHCLAFNNATKLEDVLEINKEYVVQDLSSQNVGKLLSFVNCQPSSQVWDCCAASSGKAIMAYDLISNIQLTVSDIRPSIIHNLKARFREAGIKNYRAFVTDLNPKPKEKGEVPSELINQSTTQPLNFSPHQLYDLIICDAPCTGSGTWSRTPEQLYFFKQEEITRYSDLQKKIVANVIPFLKQGGHLLYITCSVFKKENEEVAAFIQSRFNLSLVKLETLKGYDKHADTMFAALFTTSSL